MKRIIITGVTGWVGSALINSLQIDEGLEIIPISSSVKELVLDSGKSVRTYSMQEVLSLPQNNIIETELWHLAFLTKDKSTMELQSYINTNLQIRYNVEEIIKRCNVQKMVYVSSGAVYEPDGTFASNIKTNPYGFMKLQDEQHFTELANQNGICLIIPRLFSLLGSHINKQSLYAVTNFINQAREAGEIIIQAKARVLRSYIEVYELIDLCQKFMDDVLNRNSTYLFETGNVEVLELNDLALNVAKALNKNIKVHREFDPNAIDNRYIGNTSSQNILAERYGIELASHLESIQKTVDFILKSNLRNNA